MIMQWIKLINEYVVYDIGSPLSLAPIYPI